MKENKIVLLGYGAIASVIIGAGLLASTERPLTQRDKRFWQAYNDLQHHAINIDERRALKVDEKLQPLLHSFVAAEPFSKEVKAEYSRKEYIQLIDISILVHNQKDANLDKAFFQLIDQVNDLFDGKTVLKASELKQTGTLDGLDPRTTKILIDRPKPQTRPLCGPCVIF